MSYFQPNLIEPNLTLPNLTYVRLNSVAFSQVRLENIFSHVIQLKGRSRGIISHFNSEISYSMDCIFKLYKHVLFRTFFICIVQLIHEIYVIPLKPKHLRIQFLPLKKKQHFSNININSLVMFEEIISVRCENHTKPMRTKCRVSDC